MRSTPPAESPRRALAIATVSATAMIAQQVAGKVTRDALYLSYFPATTLPRAVIVASILSIAASLLFSRVLGRTSPARAVPVLFATSATLFVAEWVAAGPFPKGVAVALYLHMGVFGLLVVSGFWSVVNESFDPHAARRAVSRIGAGAALGGVVGGILADRVAALVDIRAMLLLLAGLHAVCGLGVLQFSRTTAPETREPGEERLGLAVIRASPYLQQIAWLVAMVSVTGALLDYALKAQAAETYRGGEQLVAFFAAFYTTTGIVGFVVQRLLAVKALRKLGLGGTLATLPIAVFLTSLAGSIVPRLATTVLARASETLLSNSLFRSGLELLYTPVAPGEKRPSKAIIDVAAQRGGDLIGAGLLLVVLAALPEAGIQTSLAVAGLLALVTLYVVRRLSQGYVRQLADSLRRGVITLDSQDVLDATTARTMAETRVGVDRRTLLEEVERYRSRWLAEARANDAGPAPFDAASHPEASRVAEDLLSNDPTRVRKALTREDADARVASLIIPWLGHPEVRDAASARLSEIGPRILGTLEDAMLDESVPGGARIRIPALLVPFAKQRSVDALLRGLEDPYFGLRFACGQALVRLVRDQPDLRPEAGAVLALVQKEAEVDETLWANQEVAEFDASSVLLDAPQRRRVQRSAEHVFSLLAVIFDREPLRFALFALASADPKLRGTALEYLENVLPEGVRRAVWRHVAQDGITIRSNRSTEELAQELHRTIAPLVGRRSTS